MMIKMMMKQKEDCEKNTKNRSRFFVIEFIAQKQ